MRRKPTQLLGTTIRALIAALFVCLSPLALAEDMEPYANTPSSDISALSTAQLRSIFLGKTRTWPDGTAIEVVLLEDSSPIHKKFCREALRVFSHQFRSNWNRKIYSGTGQAPTRVNTLSEMQSYIDQTTGAIGYRFINERPVESGSDVDQ